MGSPDYKAMYYHLAGRMATAVEVLDATAEALKATTHALSDISEKLKLAQQTTEEMFISSGEDDSENTSDKILCKK